MELAAVHVDLAGEAVLASTRRQALQRLADRSLEQVAAERAAQIEEQAWRAAEAIERQADQQAAEWLRSLPVRLEEVDQVLAGASVTGAGGRISQAYRD